WGWRFDHNRPDLGDVIGCVVALVGAGLIMYWPRAAQAETLAEEASNGQATTVFEVTGKTQPVPGRVGIIAAVPYHRVKEVLVVPGERVKVGQELIRLGALDAHLHARKSALADLQAELAQRKA